MVRVLSFLVNLIVAAPRQLILFQDPYVFQYLSQGDIINHA